MYSYSPFRKSYNTANTEAVCVFCDSEQMGKQTIILADGNPVENELYRWVVNVFPKFEGHTMLLPKRHITAIQDQTAEETIAATELLKTALAVLATTFPDHGIEHFAQWGAQSASSQAHIHSHLVPAHPDDSFRSFEKLGHFYTTKEDQEKIVLFPVPITLSPEELLAEFKKVTVAN